MNEIAKTEIIKTDVIPLVPPRNYARVFGQSRSSP